MTALRNPAREKELLADATMALGALSAYYANVRLGQPARIVSKAASLLRFIKNVDGGSVIEKKSGAEENHGGDERRNRN